MLSGLSFYQASESQLYVNFFRLWGNILQVHRIIHAKMFCLHTQETLSMKTFWRWSANALAFRASILRGILNYWWLATSTGLPLLSHVLFLFQHIIDFQRVILKWWGVPRHTRVAILMALRKMQINRLTTEPTSYKFLSAISEIFWKSIVLLDR